MLLLLLLGSSTIEPGLNYPANYGSISQITTAANEESPGAPASDDSLLGFFLIAFIVLSLLSLCCIAAYYLNLRQTNLAEGERRHTFANLISGVIRGNSAIFSRSIKSFTNFSRSRSSADSSIRESPVADLVLRPKQSGPSLEEQPRKRGTEASQLPSVSNTSDPRRREIKGTSTSSDTTPPKSPSSSPSASAASGGRPKLALNKALPTLEPFGTTDDVSYPFWPHDVTSVILPAEDRTVATLVAIDTRYPLQLDDQSKGLDTDLLRVITKPRPGITS